MNVKCWPEENPLTPLMIINLDKNECLKMDSKNNTIYLAPYNASAHQYYIFEHVLSENNYFELIMAQEATNYDRRFIRNKTQDAQQPIRTHIKIVR